LTTRDKAGPADAPGFEEPWQAQVCAMSQVLIETGKIDPQTWASTLGAAIRNRHADGAPDATGTYFEAVADALESVLALDRAAMTGLAEAWRSAYQATPHGQPVLLGRREGTVSDA